jgi:hypothetical protein
MEKERIRDEDDKDHSRNAHSGVALTEYALSVTGSTYGQPGGGFQPYTGPIVLQDGTHVLQFRSVDLAGNAEQLQSVEVKFSPEGMSSAVSAYYAGSGGSQATFGGQLSYRLSIIRLLVEQGAAQQAIAHMNDFLAQIRDSSVQQQGLITQATFIALEDSAKRWIQAMSG